MTLGTRVTVSLALPRHSSARPSTEHSRQYLVSSSSARPHFLQVRAAGNRRRRRDVGERFRDGTQAHSAAMRGCRVPPRPLWNEKRTHGRASAVHHPLSYRGTGGNGRDSCSPGCGTGDAGTTHRQPVRVIVPSPGARGTLMIEMGPGPLGLCPVRGVVEVEKDSSIWLANTETQPIRIEQNEVVAMAECVMARLGTNPGNGQDDRDEVNGLMERAAPHLTDKECYQLQAAMAARKHLFATGKGDLGRTNIVQHQIHTGDQPAIKQGVRRYRSGALPDSGQRGTGHCLRQQVAGKE